MKVYVLLYDEDWQNWKIVGIFSTREKAIRKQKQKQIHIDQYAETLGFKIEEWNVE
jgi:hypothetical protein